MAILGWIVFWGIIIFGLIMIGYQIGKSNGIQEEQDRQNIVFFGVNEKYQYEERMRNK